MSCRFSLSPPRRVVDLINGADADLYRDLADTDRRDDFRWLALSQGVPADRIEELWRFLRSRRP